MVEQILLFFICSVLATVEGTVGGGIGQNAFYVLSIEETSCSQQDSFSFFRFFVCEIFAFPPRWGNSGAGMGGKVTNNGNNQS